LYENQELIYEKLDAFFNGDGWCLLAVVGGLGLSSLQAAERGKAVVLQSRQHSIRNRAAMASIEKKKN